MRIFLTLFCVLLFVTKLPALEIIPKEYGMRQIDDVDETLLRVSNSILKVKVPGGRLIPVRSLSPVFKNMTLLEVKQRMLSPQPGSKISKHDRAVFLGQVDECLAQNIEDCYVFEGVSDGTAFVTGDGTQLTSAFHTFENYILNLISKNKINVQSSANLNLSNFKLPILAINAKDEVILDFNSIVKIDFLPFEVIFKNNNINDIPSYDFIKLKLSKKIAEPICEGSLLRSTEYLYLLGYPLATKDRSSFGLNDSDGEKLYVSQGKSLLLEEAESRMGREYLVTNKTNEEIIFFKKSILSADFDSTKGFSGGPILNSKGCYVGMLTNSYPYDGSYLKNKTSYGVKASFINSKE